MGISYKIDGDVAVLHTQDDITNKDFLVLFNALRNDPLYRSGMKILIDSRGSTYKSTSQEIRGAASILKSCFGSDSPIAYVASTDINFALGRMLEVYCESEGVLFQTFRTLDDAENWLREGGA